MKLKKLEVKAFAGINPNSPVVIDFSESKFVTVSGDNRVGKTSLLNALLAACGQLSYTGKDGKNMVNLDSDKIDIDFEFQGKDRCNYVVRCTKSRFELTYEGEAMPEPITKMKELLGVVGISPMEIKKASVAEIIKWLSSYTNISADDFERKMAKLKTGIRESAAARAAANKSLKSLNEYLSGEPMYNKWEESEKKYKTKVDVKSLSEKVNKASALAMQYNEATVKKANHAQRLTDIDKQIAALEKEKTDVAAKLKLADEYLEKNKTAHKDFELAQKTYNNAAAEVVAYNTWQDIKEKKKNRDEFETISQKADAKEKELKAEVTELQTEILPDVKGVELVIDDTHENGQQKKEGLYWNGKNSQQLSESEWWSLVMEIWRKYKVKVIVIDNFQSLGSMAVEVLNKLVKDGAYVLAAEMNRETKSLTINYE